jgi:hypothetical protein
LHEGDGVENLKLIVRLLRVGRKNEAEDMAKNTNSTEFPAVSEKGQPLRNIGRTHGKTVKLLENP